MGIEFHVGILGEQINSNSNKINTLLEIIASLKEQITAKPDSAFSNIIVGSGIIESFGADNLTFEGTSGHIDIAIDSNNNKITLSLPNSGVTANTYGSSTAIPIVTVDTQGRVTGVTEASISSSLTISADIGSNDIVTVGTDTLTFEGTSNEIETTVSNNKIKSIPN